MDRKGEGSKVHALFFFGVLFIQVVVIVECLYTWGASFMICFRPRVSLHANFCSMFVAFQPEIVLYVLVGNDR